MTFFYNFPVKCVHPIHKVSLRLNVVFNKIFLGNKVFSIHLMLNDVINTHYLENENITLAGDTCQFDSP